VILADTSIWVDHLRARDDALAAELDAQNVLMHPFVIGEISMGHLSPRQETLESLLELPIATVATDDEALNFIERHRLFGLGIGYIDVHLLVAVQLTADASLWTRDRRLATVASRLALALRLPH
jgi:predicted nucleic acid-binding protein